MLAVAATGLALGVLITQFLMPPRPAEVAQQPPAAQPASAPETPTAVGEPAIASEPVETPTPRPAIAATRDPDVQNESVAAGSATGTPPGIEVAEVFESGESPPAVLVSTPAAVPVETMAPAPGPSRTVEQAGPEVTQPSAPAPRPATPRERLPTYQQLPDLHPSLGEMSLTMLVYASNPARRFALINGERLRNGETLVNGAVLTEIRRDSCVIEYAGRRFLLTSAP